LLDFITLWIKKGIMILHIKQGMSAYKIVHDFGDEYGKKNGRLGHVKYSG